MAWKILVALAVLLAIGVIGYSLWSTRWTAPRVQAPTPTPTTTSPEIPLTPPITETPTSTSSASTSTSTTYEGLRVFPFGTTVQLFLDDEVYFDDIKNPGKTSTTTSKALKIKVTGFSNSLCPEGKTCIWAGELGVELLVTNQAGNSQFVNLGTIRAKTETVFGRVFTIQDIDEGKGGTYVNLNVK